MKILVFLVLMFGHFIVNAQTCPSPYKFVDKKYYSVCYSEELENPIWVKYKLYSPVQNVNKDFDFVLEDDIHTSDDDDYYNNDWDKGHLAPADDFKGSLEELRSTYSFLNCSPQHYSLNRGRWRTLESFTQFLSMTDSLLIVVEPLFDGSCKVLPTGVVIPHSYRKTIISLTSGERRIFEMPNESCPNPLMDYLIKKDIINLYWFGVE